jgi:hypothetical protein
MIRWKPGEPVDMDAISARLSLARAWGMSLGRCFICGWLNIVDLNDARPCCFSCGQRMDALTVVARRPPPPPNAGCPHQTSGLCWVCTMEAAKQTFPCQKCPRTLEASPRQAEAECPCGAKYRLFQAEGVNGL